MAQAKNMRRYTVNFPPEQIRVISKLTGEQLVTASDAVRYLVGLGLRVLEKREKRKGENVACGQ